jgi:hypothetical protein
MSSSIYDSCLFYTSTKIDSSSDLQTDLKGDLLRTDMSIVDMQTNNILMLIDSDFAAAKEKTSVDAKIMTKSRNDLDSNTSLTFNNTIIERQEKNIYFRQISQFDHLQLVNIVDFIIISFRDKIKIALISQK